MPRAKRVINKNPIQPDSRYGSKFIGKFINCMMEEGKKAVAIKIVYGAFDEIAKDVKTFANNNDQTAAVKWFMAYVVNRICPSVEVKARRVGGSNYQVPCKVRPQRGLSLALRWLVEGVEKRSEKTAVQRLAREFLDIMENKGESLKKREMVQKAAEANRAFAHLARN